jgi:hypothetical protein
MKAIMDMNIEDLLVYEIKEEKTKNKQKDEIINQLENTILNLKKEIVQVEAETTISTYLSTCSTRSIDTENVKCYGGQGREYRFILNFDLDTCMNILRKGIEKASEDTSSILKERIDTKKCVFRSGQWPYNFCIVMDDKDIEMYRRNDKFWKQCTLKEMSILTHKIRYQSVLVELMDCFYDESESCDTTDDETEDCSDYRSEFECDYDHNDIFNGGYDANGEI